MKSSLIILLFMFLMINSCKAEQHHASETKIGEDMDTIITNYRRKYDPKTGLEMYDFELRDKLTQEMFTPFVKTSGGFTIIIHPMSETGGTYDEFPPKGEFYKIQKQFYPNGKLKAELTFYLKNLKIGKWKYYDEEGNLIKEVDEGKKFEKSKIKIDNILELIERKGWINKETGKGANRIHINEKKLFINGKYLLNSQIIQSDVYFLFTEVDSIPYWYASRWRNQIVETYIINGITGDIRKEENGILEDTNDVL